MPANRTRRYLPYKNFLRPQSCPTEDPPLACYMEEAEGNVEAEPKTQQSTPSVGPP